MSSFEFNKVVAAFLTVGIVAMLGGFISEVLMHPHELEKDAVSIEIASVSDASGAAQAEAAKPAGPEPIADLLASADIARGKKLSRACAMCHSFDQGGINGAGPNLWGVFGRTKASKAGFGYSGAMKEAGGSWNVDDLNGFLYKPKKFIKGTKMNYAGIKKTEDRAAMVKWLQSLR